MPVGEFQTYAVDSEKIKGKRRYVAGLGVASCLIGTCS